MPQSPKQLADYNTRLDHFAELLSLDMPLTRIREHMGLSKNQPYKLLHRLYSMYGEGR